MGATVLCFPLFDKPSVTCLRCEKKTILKGNITTTYIKHEMLKTQYHSNLLLDSLLKYEANFTG